MPGDSARHNARPHRAHAAEADAQRAVNWQPTMRMARGSVVLLTWCLSACAPWPGAPRPAGSNTASSASIAAQTSAEQFERYGIDADRSEVLVLVYRDGPMAALGHNHVIAVRQLSGQLQVARDLAHGSFQLEFPVSALSVDEPQLRAAEGADFDSSITAAGIAGTRDHLLGPQLLDAEHYPLVQLQSNSMRTTASGLTLVTRVTVREHAAMIDVPASLKRMDDELQVSGEFDLTHTQLGLTPYSVALGALRVAEGMHVRYQLLARRLDAPASGAGLNH